MNVFHYKYDDLSNFKAIQGWACVQKTWSVKEITEISLFPLSIRLGKEEDISVSCNTEQNYCKAKGLRSCPCLVWMRESDLKIDLILLWALN